jgi:hypothetical protein
MGGIKFSGSGNGSAVVGAVNGLSRDTLNRAVLGQDIGAAGNPATLLSNREIPISTFFLRFLSPAALLSFVNIGLDSITGFNRGLEIKGDSASGDIPNLQISDPLGSPNQKYFALYMTSDSLKLDSSLGNVLTIAATQFTFARAMRNTGSIAGGRFVVDNTANFNCAGASDGRTVFTNRGAAGAITASIFNATTFIGASYIFHNVTGNAFNIQAGAGNTIRNGALLKAAPGILTSNAIGDVIELTAIGANQWIAVQVIGAWI